MSKDGSQNDQQPHKANLEQRNVSGEQANKPVQYQKPFKPIQYYLPATPIAPPPPPPNNNE